MSLAYVKAEVVNALNDLKLGIEKLEKNEWGESKVFLWRAKRRMANLFKFLT